MALGERLQFARQQMNFTLLQVSEKTQLGQSSISEFENGKREPNLYQLKALAECYCRPVQFFISEESKTDEVVLWRERPSSNSEEIEGKFLQLCRQYANLERWADEFETPELPMETRKNKESFGYRDAEELAKKVRNQLQLGDYPGHALSSVLQEKCRIKVFYMDFEPSGTAACTLSDDLGAAVLLNTKNIRWRRNFDLAHKLFHLLTWSVFRTAENANSPSESEEKFASCFARNLLIPESALKTALNSYSPSKMENTDLLFDVSRQFDVSVEALLWQMKRVFNWDDEKTNKKIEDVRKLSGIFEKRQSDTPSKFPERYESLAIRLLRKGEISIGRAAQYLEISRKKAGMYIPEED